jgi:hypothetical protein
MGVVMAALALGLFVILFAWGPSYLGWYDPNGHVALALFATFVFGIICGYKVRS